MTRKIFCSLSLLLLLGCGHSRNQQQAAAPASGQTTVAQTPQPMGSTLPPAAEQTPAPASNAFAGSAPAEQPAPAAVEQPGPAPVSAAPAVEEARSRPARRPSPYGERRTRVEEPQELIVPAGTRFRVRLNESLNTKQVRSGDGFTATLAEPIYVERRLVVPTGTTFHGHVFESKASGRLRGRAVIGLALDRFELRGASYRIYTAPEVRTSAAHKKRNLVMIGGGSGLGAAIGAIAGGGIGAAIGAGAGAAAGTAGALITGKRNLRLPAETPLVFSLRRSVSVRG